MRRDASLSLLLKWNGKIASSSPCWRRGGSTHWSWQGKHTQKAQVGRPTALLHILANYSVNELLEVEKGGMAIFDLCSETETKLNPLPLCKPKQHFGKHTYHTQHTWKGKIEQEQQTSNKAGNKSTSLLQPSPMKCFGAICPHRVVFHFWVFVQFSVPARDRRRHS